MRRHDRRIEESNGHGALAGAVDSAQATFHSLWSAAQGASSKALKARDTIAGFVEERPLTAVVIALGVGALLSRMMRRG